MNQFPENNKHIVATAGVPGYQYPLEGHILRYDIPSCTTRNVMSLDITFLRNVMLPHVRNLITN